MRDFKLKQNKGFSDLAKWIRRLRSKQDGNHMRIPRLVEAADEVIEAAKRIREGAMGEAENHVSDLGTSSSLYTWLHGVDPGDLVTLANPFDERLEGEGGEVFGTYENDDGEEIAKVYLPELDISRELPSTRLEVEETDRELSEDIDRPEPTTFL